MKNGFVKRIAFGWMAFALLGAAPAAFASASHGGGTSCQTCAGAYDPVTRVAVANCAETEDNQWGSSHCRVNCVGTVQFDGTEYGTCTCDDTQDMCLVIVVTPT